MSSMQFHRMTSSQFTNYLRCPRKRSSLSQDDVAFLLGAMCGSKVSRYEQFAREPSLETALAYEVIFQKPVKELFAGLYEEVEQQVAERAAALSRYTARKGDKHAARKVEILQGIITRHSDPNN